ncbi:MAG: iron-containing alcohol dehydrogenase [Clostridia bacterium]|nr:iron-containing alcohol dehydrogenase [Clostridia bacterium]
MSAIYQVPGKIYFGRGSLDSLGSIMEELGLKKVLVVTDKGIVGCGIAEKALAPLRAAGAETVLFDGVVPNPTNAVVQAGYELASRSGVDGIVAVGGGSPIDTAKAINILLSNEGPIQRYEGPNKVKNRGLPLVAVPTTAGTSSEITNVIALINEEEVRKYVIVGNHVGASHAVIDPLLTTGLPASITAATGIDALTHAIESYVSVNASDLTRYSSLEAARIFFHNLPLAVEDGSDVDAREEMMRGCVIVGFAFNNADLGLVHGIAHTLSARHGLPHGVANALVLPYVMEYNAEVYPEKYQELGEAMGCCSAYESARAGARKTCRAVRDLVRRVGIRSIRDYGITEGDLPGIAADAVKESALMFNPRKPITEEHIMDILRKAF